MRFCEECGTSLDAAAPAPQPAPAVVPPPSASVVPAPAPPPSTAPPQEERRLVTALFCDLVGFTPLSEQLDPEEVRDIQAAYFEAMSAQIERYGGTVEKYAGDAVLALFGASVTHEDDAERAVLCALGMQGAIEPVAQGAKQRWDVEPAIRVGVNTGEVVSGTWSASGRQDVAVTGDAVNTAARIQAAAETGEVLVGVETMRLTRRRIRYADKRELVLKGKTAPVAVYAALGMREQLGERWESSERATPLVGRDREMVELLDLWVRAQGGEGQLVTLIGDAGVGKSRLIAELVDKVAGNAGVRVVRARCLSYGQQISLWLVADVVRSLFRIGEEDNLDEVRVKLAGALPNLLTGRDAEIQAEVLDVLGEVLGLPAGNSPVANAGAQIRRQVLIRDLRLIFSAISDRAPTVVVLEDLHWIDEASEEILKQVLSDVPGLRMLVSTAQRPGWNAPWSEWGWTERISLRPLGDADAALLAGAVLGGMKLSAELEQYVADRAGGNPFFVEEMLRALEETGGLVERGGATYLVPGAAERLPSTLTEVLLARLDRLEGQVRSVAQVASVIGRSFAVRLLAQVMEREETALELPLSALQLAEIAFPRRGSDLEYVFKHVSMREAAYNTLVHKRRQQLHLATARAIAQLYPSDEYVEMIAYHYAKTDAPEAAEWLEKAGDRAAGVYANETAIAHYREARRRLEPTGAERTALAQLDQKLGAVLHTIARFDDSLQVLEQAVEVYEHARDLEAVGRVTARIGRVHRDQGTVGEGIARLEPLLDVLASGGPSRGLSSLYVALAHLYFAGGRYEDCLGAAEKAAKSARAIHDDELLAAAEMRRGTTLYMLGHAQEGIQVLEDSHTLADAAGDLTTLSVAVSNLGEIYCEVGALERGRTQLERSVELSERVGELATTGYALAMIGWVLYYLGDWDEASVHVDRGAEIIRSVGSSWYSAYPPLQIGRLQVAQGAWEDAVRNLNECVVIAEPEGDIQALRGAQKLLAELEVLDGRPEAARARLEPLADGERLREQIELLATLAWAQLELGLTQQADETVERALEIARRRQNKQYLPEVLRVRGMVRARQGGWEPAQTDFDDAVSLARSLPYPHAEARALYEWGMMHVQREEPEAARGRLQEALALFQRLGAAKEVERTRQILAGLTTVTSLSPLEPPLVQ